jgi:hypothetical protein
MPNPIGFNENDFFYNNVNAPIKFDPEQCSLSDASLNELISKTLNIPTDVKSSVIPQLDQGQGQCTFRKLKTVADQYGPADEPSIAASSWSMKYTFDSGGLQNCACVKNDPIQYMSNNLFTTNSVLTGASPIDNDTKYVCTNSIPLKFDDAKINDIHLDQGTQQQIVNSTIEYYKAVCKNRDLAAELIKTNSSNSDAELKQNDVQTFYNREYLNRINLGVGIFLTCGLIYYTFTAGTIPNNIPSLLPPVVPSLPKPP